MSYESDKAAKDARAKAVISSNNPLSWSNQSHAPKKAPAKKPTPPRITPTPAWKMDPKPNYPSYLGHEPTTGKPPVRAMGAFGSGVIPGMNLLQSLATKGAAKVLGIMGAGKQGANNFHAGSANHGFSGGGGSFGGSKFTTPTEPRVVQPHKNTIADYMSMFAGQNGGGSNIVADMSGFDAQEKDARRRAAEGDTAISGIYAALQNQIKGQDAGRTQMYNDAEAQSNATDAQATAGINAGAQSVNTQREAYLRNLGMQDQAAGNGSVEAGAAQADALGDVAQRGQINATQRNTNEVTNNNLSVANQNAAGYQGAQERASLQGNLSSMLAQIAQQRAQANTDASTANAQANATSQSDAFTNALKMYEADNSQANSDRTYQAGQDAEAWNQYLEGSKFQADQLKQASGGQDSAVTSQIDSRMQSSGIDPQQQNHIWQLMNDAAGNGFNANLLTKYQINPKNQNFVIRNLAEYNKAYNK